MEQNKESKLLTRGEILKAKDLKFEDVPVPEWGGTVRVQALTGDDRDEYEMFLFSQNEGDGGGVTKRGIRAYLLALSMVDDKGNRLFSRQDVEALGRKSYKALNRAFQAAQRLSGLLPDSVDAEKEIFGEGQNEGSGSA